MYWYPKIGIMNIFSVCMVFRTASVLFYYCQGKNHMMFSSHTYCKQYTIPWFTECHRGWLSMEYQGLERLIYVLNITPRLWQARLNYDPRKLALNETQNEICMLGTNLFFDIVFLLTQEWYKSSILDDTSLALSYQTILYDI